MNPQGNVQRSEIYNINDCDITGKEYIFDRKEMCVMRNERNDYREI